MILDDISIKKWVKKLFNREERIYSKKYRGFSRVKTIEELRHEAQIRADPDMVRRVYGVLPKGFIPPNKKQSGTLPKGF